MHVCLLPPMPKNKNKQQTRCFAAEEGLTHHPQMGAVKLLSVYESKHVVNEQLRRSAFTPVYLLSRSAVLPVNTLTGKGLTLKCSEIDLTA